MTPTDLVADLSDYNLAELKGLLFDVEQALRQRRLDEINAARAQIAEIARAAGLSVDALLRR